MKKLIFKKFKWLLVPLVLLTLNIGNAWGEVKNCAANDIRASFGSSYAAGEYDSGDGFKVASSAGYGNTANQFRVAKSATMTVSSTVGNIRKIVITVTSTSYKFNDATNISWSSTTGTYTAAGSGVTSITFTNSSANIARISNIAITYAYSTTSKTSITGLNYDYGSGPSAAQSFTVSGTNVAANLTVTAPTNFEISKSSGSGYASSLTLTHSSGTVSSTTIYVRLKSGLAQGTYGGASTYVTVTGGGTTTKNVAVTGVVSAAAAACETDPTIGDASINSSFN